MLRRPGAALIALCLPVAVACTSDNDAAPDPTSTKATPTTAAAETTEPPSADDEPTDTSTPPEPSEPEGNADVDTSDDGGIDRTVAPRTLATNPPVPLDDEGDFGDGLTTTLTGLRRVDAEAALPGEVAGPALAVTVRLENSAAEPMDLTSVSVGLPIGDGAPAQLVESQSEPLRGSLAPGEDASGTYVFSPPPAEGTEATVSVLHSADSPVVLFAGPVR